jgi:catechol 2,3-dioxygenase-like lactoylglutathione lyase family enzyme
MLASFPVVASMPAVDIERARRLYRETLGLKPVQIPVPDGALFEAGNGSQLHLYQRDPTRADRTAATFTVEDTEQVVDDLTSRGVVFEHYDMGELKTDARGIATFGPSKSAWFKDSEGNILGIVSTSTEAPHPAR